MIFLGLIFSINASFAATHDSQNYSSSKWEGTDQITTDTTTNYAAGSASNVNIKVLIYSGSYAAYSCVNGMKTCFSTANSKNLVPGYTFTYATSTVINSATLSGYDVLVMPGGSSGYDYLHSSAISGSAIKSFVYNGKGYLGICAGGYSGSYRVIDYYYGWAVAPHVTCTHPNHEGDLTVQITSAGEQVLGTSGIVTMAHYNGPAMNVSGNGIVFATYADNIIKSKGMGAIAGDFYGSGRSVICGPHPELEPRLPGIVASLAVWAANKTDPEPAKQVTLTQIASASAKVKTFYESKKRLPSYVWISGAKFTMPQLLYLSSTATTQFNSGSTDPITARSVNAPVSSTGTIKSGTIPKLEFLNVSKNITNFIKNNGRAPNFANTSLGKMSYTKLVYMYSKIWRFYQVYNRLPKNVSMK